MMTVEDLIMLIDRRLVSIASNRYCSPWHRAFFRNVSQHVALGRALSTEQARIALAFAQSNRAALFRPGEHKSDTIERALSRPEYRRPPYVSSRIPREVRHLGANKLGFRFKFDDTIMQEFKLMGQHCQGEMPRFDREHRIWVVPVTHSTLRSVERIIRHYRFDVDEDTTEYLDLARRSLGQRSTLFVDPDSGATVANICDNDLLTLWATLVAGGVHV